MTNARNTNGQEWAPIGRPGSGSRNNAQPRRRAVARALAILAIAVPVLAGPAALPVATGHATEQKPNVPRFASLRHAKANMRVGPGTKYPISWVYRRRGLPVEILRDYGIWRYLRDPWGTRGWMHVRNLTGKRTALITGRLHVLRAEPSDTAAPVVRVEPTVIGELERCQGAWCRLGVGRHTGWLRRRDLWGVYPGETVP
ncbi:MAG: SH3 domain-containing protein [Bauldia litoralis]